MSFKAIAAKLFAKRIAKKNTEWILNPHDTQKKVFEALIAKASHTKFGQDHNFEAINNHSDFVKEVPIRDYDCLLYTSPSPRDKRQSRMPSSA